MVNATHIPGLEVTIEVDNTALPEYSHPPTENQEPTENLGSTIRYIEAPSATDFSIHYLYRPEFTPPSSVHIEIVLDDTYVQAPFFEWGGKEDCEGYVCKKAASIVAGQDFTQGFRFAELRIEETVTPMTEELRGRLQQLGRIVL
ncbi:hypothetical protein Ptr902_04329 [Pyrenophora tritici-repentis]|nr:hypothetical protein Ptr902_04329 [Pyrenophora tritici-repentis]